MLKKIVFLIVVLLLVGGGFFYYWWQNQADVRELNRGLPEGVRVVKSFFGDEYWVVNQIDGYKFRVPKAWRGVRKILYVPLDEEIWGHSGSNITIEGSKNVDKSIAINYFKTKEEVEDLKIWAENILFSVIGFEGKLVLDSVGRFEVVKTPENSRIFDNFMYFFKKDSAIYALTGRSKEFIQEIILNGKW